MTTSGISYLDQVWNVFSPHCNPTPQGECANCYAARIVGGWTNFIQPSAISKGAGERFEKLPPHTVVGINFLADTWREDVPLAWISRIHERVVERPQNIFIYTTKRAERLAEYASQLPWPDNLWVGVSIGVTATLPRIRTLKTVPTPNRWISFEPLLEAMPEHLDLSGIGWVVAGGESGAKRRYFDKAWAAGVRDLAIRHQIPFYFKQGSHEHPDNDRILQGRTWDEVPAAFHQVRQKPPAPEQMSLF